jgi:hypothetical protein
MSRIYPMRFNANRDPLEGGAGLASAKRAHRLDPCVAGRHVIGRLLDLSHVSWRWSTGAGPGLR